MGYESPSEEENFHSHADAELRENFWGHPGVLFIPCLQHSPAWASQTGAGPTGEDQVVLSAYPDLSLLSSQRPEFLLELSLSGAGTQNGHQGSRGSQPELRSRDVQSPRGPLQHRCPSHPGIRKAGWAGDSVAADWGLAEVGKYLKEPHL